MICGKRRKLCRGICQNHNIKPGEYQTINAKITFGYNSLKKENGTGNGTC
jgi:hypothetical protein